ncbi:hypothetical protein [Parvibaculum sp.]|uniref:hypothetical protein n=1 Tax=Parvibaculum sp. TaxID=2024848 RepID=UPI003C74B396
MSARAAWYILMAIGAFLTGAGHYIGGPAILVLAVIYRDRMVASEDRPRIEGGRDAE